MTEGEPRSGVYRASSGFTLLEVMIAVAILGLGLTVILTAQTGLFSSSKRAAIMSQAVGLARCKMSEIEEELLREGFQLTGEDDEGPCCEDEETAGLRCKWSIIPIILPDLSQAGSADAGAGTESTTSSLDAIGEASDSLSSGDTTGAIDGLSEMAGGASTGGPSMGAGALAPMAMGLIYPQLKGMLEASIRKVTVRVVWSEGPLERDVTVTQYITNPQQGGLLSVDESMAPGAGGSSGVGTGTGTRPGARSSGAGTRP